MRKITVLSVFSILSLTALAQYPGGVPASSSNELWLDASQINKTEGSKITNWRDKSGNLNHASQSNGSLKPLFRETGLNGVPAIDFDGTDDFLSVPANSDFNSNECTHFVVFETSTVNNGSNCLMSMDFSEATNLIYTNTSHVNNQTYVKNSIGQPKRIYFGLGTNNIISATWDGNTGQYDAWLNGLNKTTTGATNTATGHNLIRIGAFGSNYKFNGNMGEIIYYTSKLNSAERNIVENYLAAKYQIGVTFDLYGHETTHNTDVVGIGEEADGNSLTASGLSNLDITASSMNTGDYVMVGHDNGGYTANTSDVPGGYNRYNQVWRSTLTNYAGTVDISFDVSENGLGTDTAYKLLVDADGVFASGATEYVGVYAAGTVTFTGVTLTSTSYFTLANSDFNILSTGTTNDWHLTTTWDCGCVPTSGSSVTIQGGHSVFIDGQNAQVGDLTIDGSLTFNASDSLEMSGNLTNNGSLSAGSGTFNFNGASIARTIDGSAYFYNLILDNALGLTLNNAVVVRGWLDIRSGTLTTNDSLTLQSNSLGTAAYMAPNTGEISGNYTVERYLNEGESWYLLGSVVADGTLEDWNQEFEMQGFTGTEWPGGYPSVYYFDQNNIVSDYAEGYTAPTNTADVLDPKVGYEIYVGDDSYASGARTIDMTGAPVLTDVSYTCPHLVKTGNPDDDGWSLITNPYPAPVRWGTVVKSANFDVAYRKLSNGSRTGMANNYLVASGEAFWVHSNAGGTTIDFQRFMAGFNEDITDNYNTKQVNSEELTLNIKLGYTYNTNPETNVAYLGFSEDATDLKDSGIDAYKLNNLFVDKPNIATLNDGKRLEYNILSMSNSSVIPIEIMTEYPSNNPVNYTLDIENVEALLANNKILVLEDRELATFTDLTQDISVPFVMNDSVTEARFFLHVTSPLTSTVKHVDCNGANNGMLLADGFGTNAKNYIWKDEFDNIIQNNANVSGADSIINLEPGTYTLEVTDVVSGTVVKNTYTVSEPAVISSDFYTMFANNFDDVNIASTEQVDTIDVNLGEAVYFESAAENATIHSWNFGDLSSSNDVNPTHFYFDAGTYKVSLTAGNGGCDAVSEQYIKVINTTGINESNLLKDVIVYTRDNDLIISFNNESNKNYDINIINSLGQQMINKTVNASVNHTETMSLDYAQGVYIVSIKNGDATKTEKIVLSKK